MQMVLIQSYHITFLLRAWILSHPGTQAKENLPICLHMNEQPSKYAQVKTGHAFGKLPMCIFLTSEVQSANSSPFISLCIVYSNIGRCAYKSSPSSAKTGPFVCTVLTDNILCPLTSSPQLPPSLLIWPALSPENTRTDPCFLRRKRNKLKRTFFVKCVRKKGSQC